MSREELRSETPGDPPLGSVLLDMVSMEQGAPCCCLCRHWLVGSLCSTTQLWASNPATGREQAAAGGTGPVRQFRAKEDLRLDAAGLSPVHPQLQP